MAADKSEDRAYIEFTRRFWRNVRLNLLLSGLSLLGAFILWQTGYQHIAVILAVVALLVSLSILMIQRFRLRHVLCPSCHHKCHAEVDSQTREYKAFCRDCNMHWCLGVKKLFGLARTRGTTPTATNTDGGNYSA